MKDKAAGGRRYCGGHLCFGLVFLQGVDICGMEVMSKMFRPNQVEYYS